MARVHWGAILGAISLPGAGAVMFFGGTHSAARYKFKEQRVASIQGGGSSREPFSVGRAKSGNGQEKD